VVSRFRFGYAQLFRFTFALLARTGVLATAEAQKFRSFLCWVEPVFGGTRFLAGVKFIPHSRDELQARFIFMLR
jgi:hypothetical protein